MRAQARERVLPVIVAALVLMLMLALAVASRNDPLPFTASACSASPGAPYATSGYRPQPEAELPYERAPEAALDLDDPDITLGSDGVIVQPWGGFPGGVYHPVTIEWYAINLLESYRATGTDAYLDRAIVNTDALLAGATRTHGALWFGYHFAHRLHGDDAMTMTPPWYSGMAQGLALSLLTRLYSETGESRWADAAHEVFASFSLDHDDGEPGFVLERAGCLWFEEYVDDAVDPVSVVNGHIYAIFGLYDYAVTFGDAAADRLFDGGATTIRESFDSFRVPGQVSMYCAAEYCARTRWTPESYHRGVAAQLELLAGLTGDATFTHLAATLRSDYDR